MIESTTPILELPMVSTELVPYPTPLWNRVIEQTQYALACGALQPIPTQYEFIEQGNIRFLVRIIVNLARKDEAKKQEVKATTEGKPFNPFLPYDKDLFVADISKTHLCLLNKFNAVDHHLLIVTREFEEQENWLTQPDFEALWICLEQIDGLVFYNGGSAAGSSQAHKHLQLVPFPFIPETAKLPIETVINSAVLDEDLIGTIPSLPFRHALIKFNSLDRNAEMSFKLYHQLLQKVGIIQEQVIGEKQTGAYNLLITREWMFLVPRSQESFHDIAVNALGFTGALLVRNTEQMEFLKQVSPMTLLKNVVPTT